MPQRIGVRDFYPGIIFWTQVEGELPCIFWTIDLESIRWRVRPSGNILADANRWRTQATMDEALDFFTSQKQRALLPVVDLECQMFRGLRACQDGVSEQRWLTLEDIGAGDYHVTAATIHFKGQTYDNRPYWTRAGRRLVLHLFLSLFLHCFPFLLSRIFGDQPWFSVPGLEEGQPLEIFLNHEDGVGADSRVTEALLRAEDPVVLQEMALRPGRLRKYLSVDYCDDAFIRGPTAIQSSINLAALLPDMPRLRRKQIKHIAVMNGSLGMEPFGKVISTALPRPLNIFKIRMANATESMAPGAFHRAAGTFERVEGHLCVRLGLITGDMKARQKAVGAYAVMSRPGP